MDSKSDVVFLSVFFNNSWRLLGRSLEAKRLQSVANSTRNRCRSFLVKLCFLTLLASFLKPVWTHVAHFPSHLHRQVFDSFFNDLWARQWPSGRQVGGRGGTPLNPAAGFHKKPFRLFVKLLVWFLKNNDNDKVLLILFKGVPPLPPTSSSEQPGWAQKWIKTQWRTCMHKWDAKWPICVQTGFKSGAKIVKKHNLNKKGRHRFRLLFATLWRHLASQERPKSRQELLKKTDKKTTSLSLSARWRMT